MVRNPVTVNRHDQWGRTAQVLSGPIDQQTTLTPIELVHFGRQPEQRERRHQVMRKAIASDFQAMVFRWAGRADPDFNVYTQFHSKSATNLVKYKHPEMDRLLEAGRSTMDPTARVAIYRQVNKLLSSEVPYMLL